MDPVTIIIRGAHDTGKTTLASLIKLFLDENGYRHVKLEDTPPLPEDQKARFWDRFTRNRDRRPARIRVELEE